MVILALESTAPSASAAVVEDGKLLSEMFLNVGLTHSVTLLPLVKNALELAELSVDDVDAVAVNSGPGSFTGVRIGVSLAKGIAQPADKKCIPVSTLEAIAYPFSDSDCIVASVMDARCRQVYGAFFLAENGKITRLTDDDAFSFEVLAEKISSFTKKVVLAGDGADIAYEHLKDKNLNVSVANPALRYQHASSVAFIAEQNINKNENILSYSQLTPTYLRLPQAERELKLKKENKK
ncbi:MAG: tRNA (adenosine(37)-N6)-threonylcarbamoyltransferase complex dimerization subunit type 1 TsaB [Clostridia bacterium]|nr:tRNA (adenosine(37)-N6)-threonylcarbamoyltransferase complex dimerization subunit type 1 TsaB [Clostridia bacterium]